METLTPGTTVGHLEVERELGRGAFAAVYLARDLRLGRHVALKVLAAEGFAASGSAAVGSFLAEARAIAGLQSPHVVTLFQLHERPPGGWMLEMEYVPGSTLADVIAGGMSAEHVEACLRGILSGLRAAHEGGILHRDIKPANVLVTEDGTAKLTDFGLARRIGDELEADGIMGTPLYMAPETLLGEHATKGSDLWSLGVLAFEMVTGKLPFPRHDAASFFSAVQNGVPEPLPPFTPAPLRAVIERCLVGDPASRAGSCGELLALLDRPVPVPPPAAPVPPAEPTRLHGREAELTRLAAVVRALPERGRVVLVAGDAGAGKSALCAEVARLARARGVVWVDARLSPVEGPLQTLVEAARAAVVAGATPATVGFGPAADLAKRLLRGEALPELQSPQQALWTIAHLLSGLATARPLALCVDDAHLASREDVALLEDLARRLGERPFLLLAAARRGSPATAGLRDAERIELGGLDREPLYALIEERLGVHLPVEAVSRVIERSAGNPLLALELARHLEASGAVVRRDGELELAEGWREDSVPERLRDVVGGRLATLDDRDRELLEVAAVDGRTFDGKAVASVLELPMLEVLRRLQRLCHGRTLIEPAEGGYRFADGPLQEVLYEGIAPELRAEVHRALATHLDARAAPADAARLGRHWERCGERARAAPHLLELARRAADRQEIHRLVEFAGRAGLLEEPPLVSLTAYAPVALRCAAALVRRARQDEAGALYDRIERAARDAGDERLVLDVELQRAAVAVTRGAVPDADPAQLCERAQRVGSATAEGQAHFIAAHLAKRRGDLDAATREFEAADRIHVAAGDDWHHAQTLDQLGSVAMRGGDLARARALYAEAGALAERIGLTTNAAVSRTNAAVAALLDHSIDGLEPELLRAVRTFDLDGNIGHAAQARIYLAEVRFAHGDTAGALEAVDAALPVLESTAQRMALANAERLRGLLLALRGHADGAKDALARAAEHAEASVDRAQLATTRAAQALAATLAGDADGALAAAGAALAVAGDTKQTMGEVPLLLAEASMFGLPAAPLEAAGELARRDGDEAVMALRDGVLALSSPDGDTAPVHAAVARLRAREPGSRRATYRLLGAWLAAAAARRDGDAAARDRETAAALETAAAMGHVHAQRALRALTGREPGC